LSEKTCAGFTPSAFRAFTYNFNDCWLVETRAYPKSRINCLLFRLVDWLVYEWLFDDLIDTLAAPIRPVCEFMNS